MMWLVLAGLAIASALIGQEIYRSRNDWRQYATSDEDFKKIGEHLSKGDLIKTQTDLGWFEGWFKS